MANAEIVPSTMLPIVAPGAVDVVPSGSSVDASEAIWGN